MKRIVKISLVAIGICISVATIAAGWYLSRALPIGTGYVAKYLCSSTFISGRNPETTFWEDVAPVNPLARIVRYQIDRVQQSVSADVYGFFGLTAIYRDGCGCALVIGTTADAMRQQPLMTPASPQDRLPTQSHLPWPEGRGGPINPADLGVSAVLLEAALDAAFDEPDPEPRRKTRAVLVIYDGHLIAERYAQGFHPQMSLLGWSMSKSVTNALVAILVQAGKLDLYQPAAVQEWQGAEDPRRNITLDQLLRMSSGLAFEENYAPLFDATEMLYGSYDFAAYAAAKPLEVQPDSKWQYSSGTANIVARIVRETIQKEHRFYYDFMHESLFDKIGMHSVVLEPDSSGTFVGSSYIFATPRDWAKFGLLYLQDGIWEGERLFPEGWVQYSTAPTPQAPLGEYGAHFWLNAGAPDRPQMRRWPNVPRDAFAAEGFQEQKVVVVPSKKLVLVRFGATTHRTSWNTDRFIQDVLEALPHAKS